MSIPFLAQLLALFALSFVACWFLTKRLRAILLDKAMLDIPNERSMHALPVPRGGGLAPMLVIMMGLAVTLFLHGTLFPYGWVFFGALLLMIVSWLDDKRGAGIRVRLLSHLVAAFLGSLALGDHLALGGIVPLWLDRALIILGWAWFMNLYNFLDGIDGITGTNSLCYALGAGLLLSATLVGDSTLYILVTLMAGAMAGFLVLNWHPAKIFLGDVGSVPLGFFVGFLLLKLASMGFLAAALLIPLYAIADTCITIAKRALRGERIWEAHRQHFYQRATLGNGRPDKTVSMILLTNLALLDAALLSVITPLAGIALGVAATTALLLWMQKTSKEN